VAAACTEAIFSVLIAFSTSSNFMCTWAISNRSSSFNASSAAVLTVVRESNSLRKALTMFVSSAAPPSASC
jgi:hypothetical protein